MKRQMIRLLALLLAMALLLAGCMDNASDTPDLENSTPHPEGSPGPDYPWLADHSPIPEQRTGIKREGISGYPHGFECTDIGVYFIAGSPGNDGDWLYYGDHGSDTIIKLCGRPDCGHNGRDCNAYFQSACSIVCYGGYLYVAAGAFGAGTQLIRMNLDGTNRVAVLESTTIEGKPYGGEGSPTLCNGMFFVSKYYPGSEGGTWDHYYYKLDGSIEQLEPTLMGNIYGSDGDYLIVSGGAGGDFEKFGGDGRYLWDPNNSEREPLYLTDQMGLGHYGAEDAYYIRDSVIYHLNYAEGQEEILLNTGLEGTGNLACFPDCFVVSIRPAGDDPEETVHTTLHFYNWDFEHLGQVELEYTSMRITDYWNYIVGETAERIILTNSLTTPRYYIEKSDFGTGHIEIHEYNMPDVDWGEIGG